MTNQANRAKVSSVKINVEFPNGESKVITIDPTDVEAIFWSDQAVNEILAPFYKNVDKLISKEDISSTFGEKSTFLMKDFGTKFRITPEFIKALWELENEKGEKSPVILKKRKCIPTQPIAL